MTGAPERLTGSYLPCTGLPSLVAQPPLPLQEFLPAQPLSPVLQPPLPLQEFLPLQSWSPLSFLSSITPAVGATVVLPVLFAAWRLATRPPERRPAMAAPARIVLL